MRATPAVMMLTYASSISRLCASRSRRFRNAVDTNSVKSTMSVNGTAMNASGSTPGPAAPAAPAAIAVETPVGTMIAARTIPAIPKRRCTSMRRARTSPVCTTNRATQAVNTNPWKYTSGVSSRRPPSVGTSKKARR